MRKLLPLTMLVCGCTDAPAGKARISRDSAGIEIVENKEPAWTDGARWRLSDQPTLQIGEGVAGDSTKQFGYVAGATLLSNGNIAVLDSWAYSLRFFDQTGNLIGRVGRQGTGPGEFPWAPRTMVQCGDSIYILIGVQIAIYTQPGTWVRTFQPQKPMRIRACVGNRLVADARHSARRTEPGLFTDSVVLGWLTPDGAIEVIDSLPSQERDWHSGPAGLSYSPAMFGRALAIAGSADWLATGFGTTHEVRLRDAAGKLQRIVRVNGRERTVSKAEIDRFREFLFKPYGANERGVQYSEAALYQERLNSAEGQPWPAFAELRIDRVGNIWVRDYDHRDAVSFFDNTYLRRDYRAPNRDPRTWVVLNPEGRYLGEIMTPPNFDIKEIGEDWVLGVARDELDVQYVRKYGLIKPGA